MISIASVVTIVVNKVTIGFDVDLVVSTCGVVGASALVLVSSEAVVLITTGVLEL